MSEKQIHFQAGQVWANEKGTLTMHIRAVEENTVHAALPEQKRAGTGTPLQMTNFIDKYDLSLKWETINVRDQRMTFKRFWHLTTYVRPELRADLIIKAREAKALSDEELDRAILELLPGFGDEGERVYRALNLEPFAWPLRKAQK